VSFVLGLGVHCWSGEHTDQTLRSISVPAALQLASYSIQFFFLLLFAFRVRIYSILVCAKLSAAAAALFHTPSFCLLVVLSASDSVTSVVQAQLVFHRQGFTASFFGGVSSLQLAHQDPPHVCLYVMFVHSRFVKNPPIDLDMTNPSFLRWFCHILHLGSP
jgi:hypothetical protein